MVKEIRNSDHITGKLRHCNTFNIMEIGEAARLIQFNSGSDEIQLWADLGCGSGTFTYALATHLYPHSTIYAVDQNEQKLQKRYNQVEISFVQSDFSKGIDNLPELHGIVMANSLHYIRDKTNFLSNVRQKLKRGRRQLLVVEYETENANSWVPYPISSSQLLELFQQLGAIEIKKLGAIPSRYHGEMYAVMIHF